MPCLPQQQFLGARQIFFGDVHLHWPYSGNRLATQKILDTACLQNCFDTGLVLLVSRIIETCHVG